MSKNILLCIMRDTATHTVCNLMVWDEKIQSNFIVVEYMCVNLKSNYSNQIQFKFYFENTQ